MSIELRPAHFTALAAPLVVEVPSVGALEMSVEEVKALPSHRMRAEPFSLQLRGPRAPLLPQAIYPVVHPSLGRLELFLVPIRSDGAGSVYEAVFN